MCFFSGVFSSAQRQKGHAWAGEKSDQRCLQVFGSLHDSLFSQRLHPGCQQVSVFTLPNFNFLAKVIRKGQRPKMILTAFWGYFNDAPKFNDPNCRRYCFWRKYSYWWRMILINRSMYIMLSIIWNWDFVVARTSVKGHYPSHAGRIQVILVLCWIFCIPNKTLRPSKWWNNLKQLMG